MPNLPGYKCPLCKDPDCSTVNGTNCMLRQFSQVDKKLSTTTLALLQIANGKGDPQFIAHKALVDICAIEPDEFDT